MATKIAETGRRSPYRSIAEQLATRPSRRLGCYTCPAMLPFHNGELVNGSSADVERTLRKSPIMRHPVVRAIARNLSMRARIGDIGYYGDPLKVKGKLVGSQIYPAIGEKRIIVALRFDLYPGLQRHQVQEISDALDRAATNEMHFLTGRLNGQISARLLVSWEGVLGSWKRENDEQKLRFLEIEITRP